MSYRIKVPTKTLQVDEAHLLSGLSINFIGSRNTGVPCWSASPCCCLRARPSAECFGWTAKRPRRRKSSIGRPATADGPFDTDPKNAESPDPGDGEYREIVEQHPRTAAAPLALFHLGNTQFQANDLPAAIDTYQRLCCCTAATQRWERSPAAPGLYLLERRPGAGGEGVHRDRGESRYIESGSGVI